MHAFEYDDLEDEDKPTNKYCKVEPRKSLTINIHSSYLTLITNI